MALVALKAASTPRLGAGQLRLLKAGSPQKHLGIIHLRQCQERNHEGGDTAATMSDTDMETEAGLSCVGSSACPSTEDDGSSTAGGAACSSSYSDSEEGGDSTSSSSSSGGSRCKSTATATVDDSSSNSSLPSTWRSLGGRVSAALHRSRALPRADDVQGWRRVGAEVARQHGRHGDADWPSTVSGCGSSAATTIEDQDDALSSGGSAGSPRCHALQSPLKGADVLAWKDIGARIKAGIASFSDCDSDSEGSDVSCWRPHHMEPPSP